MAAKKIKRKMDREQIKHFIDVYKHHSCLWDVSNKDYTNKRKRAVLLRELVPILGANATLDTVRNKIDILRNSYFREWKKVQASKGTSDVYVPTLFYYNQLCFLTGEEPQEEPKQEISLEDQEIDDKSQLFTLLTEGKEDKGPSPKKRKRSKINKSQDEFVNVKKQKSYITSSEPMTDNTFGLYLNQQLLKLPRVQRTFAEKLMSDVLFMARTNQLNGTSQIITPLETNYLSDLSGSD